MCACTCDLFLGLLALLFPPLPVWVKRGICSADSIINILLCMLGYLPGLFHAWYIIAKFPDPDFDYEVIPQDSETGGNSHITYVVVHPTGRSGTTRAYQAAPKLHDGMNYGTTSSAPEAAGAASSSPAPAPAAAAAASSSSSAAAPVEDAGEGSSSAAAAGPPPSYAQVIAGDNKIQNQD